MPVIRQARSMSSLSTSMSICMLCAHYTPAPGAFARRRGGRRGWSQSSSRAAGGGHVSETIRRAASNRMTPSTTSPNNMRDRASRTLRAGIRVSWLHSGALLAFTARGKALDGRRHAAAHPLRSKPTFSGSTAWLGVAPIGERIRLAFECVHAFVLALLSLDKLGVTACAVSGKQCVPVSGGIPSPARSLRRSVPSGRARRGG